MSDTLIELLKEALDALEENHILVADNRPHRYVMWHLSLINDIRKEIQKQEGKA